MRKQIRIYLLSAITLLGAETQKLIDARDLISFPSVRSLDLNTEKQVIVYELRTTDFDENTYRNHLWSMGSNGDNVRQLTYSSGNEWSPQISPNGHCVAFFSDRPDESDKGGTRIWVMPLAGGEAKPLTDPDRTIINFKWDSNSSKIYYLTPEMTPERSKTWIEERESSGFDALDRTAEKPHIELWSVCKESCEHLRLFVGDPGVTDFDIDPKNETLVYSTNYTGDENDWVETDLYLYSLIDSSQIRQLTEFKGAEDEPRFSPGGNLIAYKRPQDPKKPFSQTEIEVITRNGSQVRRLTRDLDLHISDYSWYNSGAILLEVNQGMNNQLYAVNLSGAYSELTGGPAYFYRSKTNHNSQGIVAVRQTATSLGEIVYSKGAGRPWRVLTNMSAELDDLIINPQASFSWLSRDEKFRLQGLVVLPQNSGYDPLPLIVDIHGGPAGRTDIALEQFVLYQAWASQGFAVFSPNFRGSEGYNAQFQISNYKDLGGGDYQDIISGVKALIKRGIAHPDSLVIMGGSYGGYMTNWAITQTNMFKVAVSRYGIFDLKNDFSNSIYAQWELDYLGKPYWDDPSLYRRMSPSAFIKKAKTPTLILHGADDENTFTSNSRELARALETLDVPHRFFVYPREGHGMDEPNHRLDVFNRQLSWINLHLDRQQALNGEDWLKADVRVQILSANNDSKYLNKPGKSFLSIKLIIDGSRLKSKRGISLADFQIEPEQTAVLGLPSGQVLALIDDFRVEIGPDSGVIELDLVFPRSDQLKPVLSIEGIGKYQISF
ncbi:MAG: S9 family peptidase [Candidatus Marinimicrobia bacterium]|nr:S9 family peptidase [Candidatus Neomarinimicrobiota bacterium]